MGLNPSLSPHPWLSRLPTPALRGGAGLGVPGSRETLPGSGGQVTVPGPHSKAELYIKRKKSNLEKTQLALPLLCPWGAEGFIPEWGGLRSAPNFALRTSG
jgi:hypothetical protein